ncbi:hypothetical protein Leryth_023649 [Lithospermum erythrorhizon]|nr:hypothetical protein Leryth_023649 [Lithospermum erythrorhizon]
MNFKFILADTLQKIFILCILFIWCFFTNRGCLEWTITLFSLSTLPNTLVMGIPLLKGMYGDFSGSLMVQIVVLQCIIWYTLMGVGVAALSCYTYNSKTRVAWERLFRSLFVVSQKHAKLRLRKKILFQILKTLFVCVY